MTMVMVKRLILFLLILVILWTGSLACASSRLERVLSVAVKQIGAPYEVVSHAPRSFNCFSFVAYCYNKVRSGTVSENGVGTSYQKIFSIKSIQPGDILGFRSSKALSGILGYHFGIYLGKGYFIHAANQDDGVIVSRLKSYKKRFVGAIRIFT